MLRTTKVVGLGVPSFRVCTVFCCNMLLSSYFRTITKNEGKPPMTYQRLQTVLSKMGPPPKPVESLTADTVKGKKRATDRVFGYIHRANFLLFFMEKICKSSLHTVKVIYKIGSSTTQEVLLNIQTSRVDLEF